MTQSKKSSGGWRRQQCKDPGFQKAKKLGLRSRAGLKLIEIQQQERLFKRGHRVLDLGAAPGGWSQVAVDWVGPGNIIAIDLLPIQPLAGVECLCADLRDLDVQAKLIAQLRAIGTKDIGVQLVISDMAPNISGIKLRDQANSLMLGQLAYAYAERFLAQGGVFLVKLFQGPDLQLFFEHLKPCFKKLKWLKPKASRSDSAEVYLLGKGYYAATDRPNVIIH